MPERARGSQPAGDTPGHHCNAANGIIATVDRKTTRSEGTGSPGTVMPAPLTAETDVAGARGRMPRASSLQGIAGCGPAGRTGHATL